MHLHVLYLQSVINIVAFHFSEIWNLYVARADSGFPSLHQENLILFSLHDNLQWKLCKVVQNACLAIVNPWEFGRVKVLILRIFKSIPEDLEILIFQDFPTNTIFLTIRIDPHQYWFEIPIYRNPQWGILVIGSVRNPHICGFLTDSSHVTKCALRVTWMWEWTW